MQDYQKMKYSKSLMHLILIKMENYNSLSSLPFFNDSLLTLINNKNNNLLFILEF